MTTINTLIFYILFTWEISILHIESIFLIAEALKANEDARWMLLKKNKVNITYNIYAQRSPRTVASTDGWKRRGRHRKKLMEWTLLVIVAIMDGQTKWHTVEAARAGKTRVYVRAHTFACTCTESDYSANIAHYFVPMFCGILLNLPWRENQVLPSVCRVIRSYRPLGLTCEYVINLSCQGRPTAIASKYLSRKFQSTFRPKNKAFLQMTYDSSKRRSWR